MYGNINIEIIAFLLTYMKNPVILQQVGIDNAYNLTYYMIHAFLYMHHIFIMYVPNQIFAWYFLCRFDYSTFSGELS